jgi:hypothetical protein
MLGRAAILCRLSDRHLRLRQSTERAGRSAHPVLVRPCLAEGEACRGVPVVVRGHRLSRLLGRWSGGGGEHPTRPHRRGVRVLEGRVDALERGADLRRTDYNRPRPLLPRACVRTLRLTGSPGFDVGSVTTRHPAGLAYAPGFSQTDTCQSLSLVNASLSQLLHRSRSLMPASFAIRSSSDGQTYR